MLLGEVGGSVGAQWLKLTTTLGLGVILRWVKADGRLEVQTLLILMLATFKAAHELPQLGTLNPHPPLNLRGPA